MFFQKEMQKSEDGKHNRRSCSTLIQGPRLQRIVSAVSQLRPAKIHVVSWLHLASGRGISGNISISGMEAEHEARPRLAGRKDFDTSRVESAGEKANQKYEDKQRLKEFQRCENKTTCLKCQLTGLEAREKD